MLGVNCLKITLLISLWLHRTPSLDMAIGLPYTYDEAVEYVDQRDDEDLTADEAKAVAGGWVACVIVGFGGLEADTCGGNEWTGAAACAGLGVGMSAI